MLIDSGAELCLMSREVFEELGIPIDLSIDWSVGSANSQKTKAYGIYHDVPVVVRGITARCRFFVLENLSQDVILGRPWERLARAKHDNRDDGSCYTTIYDEHENTATFCSVPTYHERNRAEAKFVTANPQELHSKAPYASDGRKVVYGSSAVEEVHVDNKRDVFTLRSEAERGLRAIEEGGTYAYTCDAKLEDIKLKVEKLGDGRLEDEELEDGALNDAELDDADLTYMYTHVSELADDAKDKELANSENDSDGDDSEDKDDNNELEEVMDADLTPAGISELGDEDNIKNEDINDNDEDGNDDMLDDLMRVKRYLSTLRRPDGMTDRAFGALR